VLLYIQQIISKQLILTQWIGGKKIHSQSSFWGSFCDPCFGLGENHRIYNSTSRSDLKFDRNLNTLTGDTRILLTMPHFLSDWVTDHEHFISLLYIMARKKKLCFMIEFFLLWLWFQPLKGPWRQVLNLTNETFNFSMTIGENRSVI
jgi:hypothetical protein